MRPCERYGQPVPVTPAFRHLPRTLFELTRTILAVYSLKGLSQFAAAISYRALFSLVPLATFVATIVGVFFTNNDERRQRLVDAISEHLHQTETGATSLDDLIASVPSPWSAVGLFSLLLAVWGATGVMHSVRKALAVIFDEGVTLSFARGKLVDALLVVCVVILLLVAVTLSWLEQIAAKASEHLDEALDWQPYGVGFLFGVVAPLLLTTVVFLLVYRLVPRSRPPWRSAIIGATVGALGFQLIQFGLGWYLAEYTDFSAIYGSGGAVFATLLSIYLGALAFLVGALLTWALAGSDTWLPLTDTTL
jgi:membrane protein